MRERSFLGPCQEEGSNADASWGYLFVAWAGVYGAPAGARWGPWFSPAVAAGAPAPSQNWLKACPLTDTLTSHLLYFTFIYVE